MGGLTDVIESDAKKLLSAVGSAAPLLASVLGSPLAGVAVSLVSQAFGVPSNNVDQLVAAIGTTPDAAAKLKQLEYDHLTTLMQIQSTGFQLQVQDKQDARKYMLINKNFLKIFAIIVTLGFFSVMFLMFTRLDISPVEKNLVSMLVGMLASKWQTIVDFYYGSSSPNYVDKGV